MAVRRAQPGGQGRRAGGADRPVRLRQVDRAAHDQPADRADRRPDPARRRGRHRRRPGASCAAGSATSSRTSGSSRTRRSGPTWHRAAACSAGPATGSGARVDELLELVGLDPAQFGRRYPHELSGGQRQRVGVARALAADPVVLLMDEPFSAVDPIVRARLQEEFLRLQAEVRKTIVLVTHDLDEAVRLGDRIAVLSEGGPAGAVRHAGRPARRARLAVRPRVRRRGPGHPPAGGHPARPGRRSSRCRPTPPRTCPPWRLGGTAYDALAAMLTSGADAVVVTDDGQPVGALSRQRLLDLGRPTGLTRAATLAGRRRCPSGRVRRDRRGWRCR